MSIDFHKPSPSTISEKSIDTSKLARETRSQNVPDRFLADFIYNERSIEDARSQLATLVRTAPQAELTPLKEGAFELCLAFDEHERANTLYHDSWLSAIQKTQQATDSTLLTRSQFDETWRSYAFRSALEQHEIQAMQHYRKALNYLQTTSFQLRPTIALSKSDVEIFINDLAARRVNRHGHDEDRQLRFFELDRQLQRIIRDIPQEEVGKRAELQELYLLRRLIRDADADHLVQVEHASIREDLMPSRGGADIVLTIAGVSWNIQAKTLLRKTTDTKRAIQYDVMQRAKRKTETQNTLLVEFELDTIAHEYTKASNESLTSMSKLGKREALSPLFDALPEDERTLLLHILRLTDVDLSSERQLIVDKERELETTRVNRLQKQAAEAARLAQAHAEHEAQIAREEAARLAEEERLAAIERRRFEQAEADRQVALRLTAERFNAQAAKLAEIEAGNSKRSIIAKQQARLQKAAATRMANAEERAKFWLQGPIMKIAIPRHLVRLGFLREDWSSSGGIDALNLAKQAFANRFAKAKKDKLPSITDPVNDEFIHTFPTADDFEKSVNG